MPSYSVTVDDSGLKSMLKDIGPRLSSELKKAVNSTTAYGLRVTKEEEPKRSGNLRESFKSRKINDLTMEIFPGNKDKVRYAETIEYGAAAHTVVPKRAKFLTIPLDDRVLTGTRSQIRKSALDNLFRQLKNRKGRDVGEIFDEVGIALAKRANIPARKGQYILRDRVVPKIEVRFDGEVRAAIDRAVV